MSLRSGAPASCGPPATPLAGSGSGCWRPSGSSRPNSSRSVPTREPSDAVTPSISWSSPSHCSQYGTSGLQCSRSSTQTSAWRSPSRRACHRPTCNCGSARRSGGSGMSEVCSVRARPIFRTRSIETLATSASRRANALRAASVLAWAQGDYDAASDHARSSLDLHRELGDEPGMTRALISLGLAVQARGELAEARAFHEESRRLASKLDLANELGAALANLGDVSTLQGDLAARAPSTARASKSAVGPTTSRASRSPCCTSASPASCTAVTQRSRPPCREPAAVHPVAVHGAYGRLPDRFGR